MADVSGHVSVADPIPAVKPLSENTANGESIGADYYKQRLSAIRAQCGLDSSEVPAPTCFLLPPLLCCLSGHEVTQHS